MNHQQLIFEFLNCREPDSLSYERLLHILEKLGAINIDTYMEFYIDPPAPFIEVS